MKIKIWTLAFSPGAGGFDDAALQHFLRDKDLVCFWEHLFTHEGRTHLVCIVEWEERDERWDEGAHRSLAGSAGSSTSTPSINGARRRPRAEGEPDAGLEPEDKALFGSLRAWRASKAREQAVPAYRILTNRELRELVQRKPADAEGLARIPGLGERRVASYGEEILRALRESSLPVAAPSAPPSGATQAPIAAADASPVSAPSSTADSPARTPDA